MLRQTMLAAALLLTLLVPAPCVAAPNALTEQERADGFELLFNGVDFDGWKQAGNWKIEDGALYRAANGGDLTYVAKKVPDDFELRFDWRVAKGCNSGVYYRPGQYEYQVLDNPNHRNGRNPRQSAASLFFCIAPSKDVTRPVGEWNEGRIVCQGTIIQHWLNGEKVIDFDYTDPRWAAAIELLSYRGTDLNDRGAHLRLQDHGDAVWYRNVKLRELAADAQIHHKTVTPMPIPAAARAEEEAFLERSRNK